MKPWREVVVPHRDIREGRFDESVFAADLSDVVADRGPLEYRDPELFFRKTYPSQGMVHLLSALISRLSGKGSGEPVIQIQTPFGGGKTHSLIALYHLCRASRQAASSELGVEVLKQAGVKELPKVRIVTFVGTAADPVKGKTPWGLLAEQLGDEAALKEHDKKRRSPGKDLLHGLLGRQPTLLLMDEIAEYAVKARDFNDQLMAFFQELTETVKVLPQCALVVTLPSSAPYGEVGERALDQLQRIFGRVEAIYTPVEGEEIYEIIRRRLFEEVPDVEEARRTAESYWELYRRLGDDMPREVQEPAYRDRLRKAYPFHPELIGLLYERWSTFSTFQRTRGVLRLLAEVVADLYRREHSAPLIQPAHVNLATPSIRREFLKHIGNEFEGLIADDIVGGSANAQRLDQEMGSEYARFGVASGLATAIFVGSFSGAEKKGVSVQRLRLAILRDGIPPALVGDALRRLEDELWYLHHAEDGLYAFSNQPNLNHILIEKEEAVQDEHIVEELKGRLASVAGSELRVTLWPHASQDVPDTRELKLAVLDFEYAVPGAPAAFAEELLKKSGLAFRTYQNTLLIVAPDAGELASLRQKVKQLLALRAIRQDQALVRRLSEENRKGLEIKIKDTDADVNFRILVVYRHLGRASESGLHWENLGLPTVGERVSLSGRVRDYLKAQDVLLDRLSPRQLLQKALKEGEEEKPLGDILDAFLRYPNLPIPESDSVLHNSIIEGVRQGVFSIKVDDRIYAREELLTNLLDASAVLLRKVPELQPVGVDPDSGAAPGYQPGGADPSATGKASDSAGASPAAIRTLMLRVKVPWDKFSEFFRGVLMPLKHDGAELEVDVTLQASSESGIKRSTLEQKVKETLNQIGATILDEDRQ